MVNEKVLMIWKKENYKVSEIGTFSEMKRILRLNFRENHLRPHSTHFFGDYYSSSHVQRSALWVQTIYNWKLFYYVTKHHWKQQKKALISFLVLYSHICMVQWSLFSFHNQRDGTRAHAFRKIAFLM